MTTTPATTPAPALDRLFSFLRRSPVTRSSDRVVAGVCAGIAQRLGVSTGIVRVAAVVATILGPGFVLYLAAWLFLPDSTGRIRFERAVRDGDGASIALLVVTALAVIPDVGGHAHFGWLPLVALGVLAVVGHKSGWWGHGSAHRNPWNASTTAPDQTTTNGQPQDAPR